MVFYCDDDEPLVSVLKMNTEGVIWCSGTSVELFREVVASNLCPVVGCFAWDM